MEAFLKNNKSSWETLQNTKLPIIIYGMGNGADKVLNEFSRLNIKAQEVIASDEFVRGQSFHNFKVKRLKDIEEKYEDFIIAICFASQIKEVIDNIKEISKNHKTLVPCVPVFGNTIFNRDFINNNMENLKKTYTLLEDEISKNVLTGMVKFQFTGDLNYLWSIESSKTDALNNILKINNKEKYLDIGAYRGDTIEEFLKFSNNKYSKIIAVEPDEKTFKKLEDYTKNIKNTSIYQKGIWKKEGYLNFKSRGGRHSNILDNIGDIVATLEKEEKASIKTSTSDNQLDSTSNKNINNNSLSSNNNKNLLRLTTIDNIVKKENNITYIKIDVEGVEKEALLGGLNTLQTQKPKLNIAAYHKSKDIFTLPLLLKEINPNYKIYLRHHPYCPCWDTNLYCI